MASTLDLTKANIVEMSGLLQRRDVSPVELIEATLERIEALNHILRAFTIVTPEYAIQRARESEREIAAGRYRGPLHGIPYTLKDVIATKGIRTTFGNPRGIDFKPKESATVHTLLENAGGILVGKVVSEIGRRSDGPVGCFNPWDIIRSPGSSSSGSGSAVAASLCLASVGTDTGGSVRHPGSNCGLVAMKATHGRISRFGVAAHSWTLDQAGPLTKTVEDNAIMLETLGVYDPKDPISLNESRYNYRAMLKDSIKGVRVGVPIDRWIWECEIEEVEELLRLAVGVLEELGAQVCEVVLPLAAEARASVLIIIPSESVVYWTDNFPADDLSTWTELHPRLEEGRKTSFADYIHAQQKCAFVRQELASVLKQVDVIAMPTSSTLGDKFDASTAIIRGKEVPARSRAVYLNALASLAGVPALSVPCGFALGDRLPVGMQLLGRHLEEALLYCLASHKMASEASANLERFSHAPDLYRGYEYFGKPEACETRT